MASVDKSKLKNVQKDFEAIKKEIAKSVVGQGKVVEGILRGLIANGHILIEGLPGIAKTLVVRTVAEVTGCKFSRIQFTVDLLPSDIVGITTYDKSRGFTILKGPVFANFVMADEINRATPKTQSALLEAMQEKQVTIGRTTYPLDKPFFVMATQNPIEQSGVYELPEAQVDRFLFKLKMDYPTLAEEELILEQNMTLKHFNDFKLKPIWNPKKILELQNLAKDIHIDNHISKYIVDIIDATRNPDKYKVHAGKYLQYGSSPRASIGLFISAKTQALLKGSDYVKPQHVKDVAYDVLRHRLLLNYEGQAENIDKDTIVKEILERVPTP